MLRILTIAVVIHWAAIFSMLAFICVMAGSGGAAQALDLVGLSEAIEPRATPASFALSAGAALVFAICGTLFWWALATIVMGGDHPAAQRDILSLAFASGIGALSAIFVCGVFMELGDLFPTVAIHVAALLISYVAVSSERHSLAERTSDAQATATPVPERPAAHAALLARIAARPTILSGESRQ